MPSFIVHSRTRMDWSGLAFERGGEKLLCLGAGDGIPDVIVQTFDPERDIFYRAESTIHSSELEEEVGIHFPDALRKSIAGHIFPSTLAGSVLMQHVSGEAPALSPLTALATILERTGSVNAAILQADNGGLTFVRRAGEEQHAHLDARSLREFIEIDPAIRQESFPDFETEEIILSGSDLDHFQNVDISPFTIARRISIDDFGALCEFTEDAMKLVSSEPNRYTLAIGAAFLYDEILREAQ